MKLPSSSLRALLCFCIIAITASLPANAQSTPADATLNIEEVVKLSRAGFSEELIITKIKKNGKAFDLSTDELLELKKDGLSDNVIKYLLDPSQPYSPAPPPPVPQAAKPSDSAKSSGSPRKFPEDAFAIRVPPDSGLYLFTANRPAKVDLKLLLGTQESAGLGKLMMKKPKAIAYLVGPAARLRTTALKPVFYMRLPEAKEITDFVLVALVQKGDRREIDVGTPGPKQELKADAMRQFDSVEVAPRLFKLTPAELVRGEYLFFLMGSANPEKATYGKGYDFGIDQKPSAKRK